MKGYFSVGLVALCLLISVKTFAVTCSAMFPTAAQTHSAGGVVTMQSQAIIAGSGTVLRTGSIVNNTGVGWNSCSTAVCTASASASSAQAITLLTSTGANGAISAVSGTTSKAAGHYTTVGVNSSAALTFTTSGGSYYFSGDWGIQGSTVVTLAPGDYWITGNVFFNDNAQIKISGTGTVRFFVSGTLQFNNNVTTPSVSSQYLLFYARGNISTGNNGNIHAFMYSHTGTVSLGYQSVLYGGVAAPSAISFNSLASLTYESANATAASFGSVCTAVPTLHHFVIDVGAGTGSNCAASSITITAQDSANATLTTYTGSPTIRVSTNHGDWAKTATASNANGTLTAGASDSGAASYTFVAGDAGDIILNLTNTHAEALTITVADASASVSTVSSTLTFSKNAFVITSTDTLANDVVAGRPHNFRVSMMRQDPSAVSCSVATGYNVAAVKMWLTRVAAQDPGGAAPAARNSANTSVSLANSKPASNNVTLSFANGIADFALITTDVGKYAISIADGSNTFASSEILGASNNYVVRPFGLAVAVTGNTAASSATGTVFKRAGENFSVTVTAKAWSSADDGNDDGIADNHNDTSPGNNANLSDNSTLLKFGAETPGESVSLSALLNLPAAGVNPGLGDGDASATDGRILASFSNGVATTSNVYFAEVGIIEINAAISDGDYLGAGASATTKILSKSGFVGRFRPAQFALSSGVLTPACAVVSEFTYLSQPFATSFTLTAQNFLNGTTANYTGAFAKLAVSDVAFKAFDTTTTTALTSRLSNASVAFTWGAGTASASGNLTLARGAAPDGPFDTASVGLNATDSDSVTFTTSALNLDTDNNAVNDAILLRQSKFRFGRLRLEDSFGPETARLPVTFVTEYWANSSWNTHSFDSCTAIATSAISYPVGPISVIANRAVSVGGGTSTGSYTNLAGAAVNFSLGDAGHYFSAPGSGNTGNFSVNVNLTAYPWLRFDWNNDGVYSDISLPAARFTFGNYRGHDREIFWQETLN